MSDALIDAATTLTRMLRAETAALLARDLRGAAALQQSKSAAIDAFLKARATGVLRPGVEHHVTRLVDTLHETTAENRAALEAALVVQARVVDAIARTARRSEAAGMPGYARPTRSDTAPLALSVRA